MTSALLELLDATGGPVAPDDLLYATRRLSDETAARLIARCAREGSIFAAEHATLGAHGVAGRLCLAGLSIDTAREVKALLAAIAPSSATLESQKVPLALGALSFDNQAASAMVIPELCVFVGEKSEPELLVCAKPDRLEAVLAELDSEAFLSGTDDAELEKAELPDAFSLTSVRSHQDFKDAVSSALGAIARGELSKVVLAREVLVVANRPFVQHDLLARLHALYPSCARFAIEGFIGASPELLVHRLGAAMRSQPLAGTAARTGDPEDDARRAGELLASPKERAEHRLVVDAIAAELGDVVVRIDVPERPHLLELRNVVHLATTITAELAPDKTTGEVPNALELVARLHPTPAIGGVPRTEALAFLATHEHLERARYAGPVGYLSASGDGEFFIGIRSAIVDGDTARLIAGVGIVEGSDPDAELVETQLKLQALLSAAVRP